MSIITTALLAGIGIAAGSIFYNYYIRKEPIEEAVEIASETPISISFTAPTAVQTIFDKAKPAAASKTTEQRKSSPLQAACGICKEAAMLPFRCKFCSSLYCGEHRIPESHDCSAL